MKYFTRHKKWWGVFILFFVLLIFWFFSLPENLFPVPYSTVVLTDREELVGCRLAADGQWRFPEADSVPYKLKKATITFEDQYFYNHPGVNPFSIFRAVKQNISGGHIVSGGSTISMQVIRMSRGKKERSVKEKLIEAFLATRLEARYTKDQILQLYASNAPYGGNTVGIQTASWRYFLRDGRDLSWAEAALLAVLPNSPAMIHPGKNRKTLLEKRNRLLYRLYQNGEMNRESYDLSVQEPLPGQPYSLQMMAPHLVDRIHATSPKKIVHVSIDADLQKKVEALALRYHDIFSQNMVQNLAILVMETSTGNVLAYCGNAKYNQEDNNQVDVITAPRSTGSILKPFLYNAMIENGDLLPTMLVPDIPIQIAGYKPQNFSRNFSGAEPAAGALALSLNIPAVLMLKQYGVPKFKDYLQHAGISTVNQSADHYGLTLILGGAEASLWEVSGVYASMARTLNRYNEYYLYSKSDLHAPRLIRQCDSAVETRTPTFFHAAAVWHTMDALKEVHRPGFLNWRDFASSRRVGWKTGTSFGNRDAWAVGTTPEYVVGVWVGNADGEGRPELTGIIYAAPLMFAVYNLLPETSWFVAPDRDMVSIEICPQSGYRRGPNCPEGKYLYVYRNLMKVRSCPYHQLVHLTKDEQHRVTSKCISPSEMVHKSWFVLPPTMEHYYRLHNSLYKVLPPYMEGCENFDSRSAMDFIYPKDTRNLYLPREANGEIGEIVFEVAHRNSKVTLYWHLDDVYLGSTTDYHQMGIKTNEGAHTVTVVDDNGNQLCKKFNILTSNSE